MNVQEIQEIEGGILPIVAVGLAVLYIGGTLCALADGKKLNGMPLLIIPLLSVTFN